MTILADKKNFKSLNRIQIDEQIELRKDLLKQMVGQLYPAILQDEIVELRRLLSEEIPDSLFEMEE